MWLINASTGHVAASVSSKTYMRSGITALCVDETGGAVWAGDEDGKVFAISSTRRLATTTAKSSRESDSIDERSSEDPTGAAAAVARHPTVGHRLRAAASRLALPRLTRASRHRLAIVARVKPPFGSGSRGGVRTLRRFAYLRATRGAAVVAFFRDGTVAVYRAPIGAALENLTPVSAVVTPGWPAGGFGGADASPPRNPTAPLLVVSAARGEGAATFAIPETHGAPAMRDAALAHGSGFGADGIASAAAVAFDGDGGFVAVGYEEVRGRDGVGVATRRGGVGVGV